MLIPLSVGNAVRVFIRPEPEATRWRILRKQTPDFAGPDDPEAVRVMDGQEEVVLDTNFLVNGTTYHYRDYQFVHGVWIEGDTKSVAPAAIFEDQSVDVQAFLRDRLDYGFAEYLRRGILNHAQGKIPILTSPPTTIGEGTLPIVVIKVVDDVSADRGIGEMFDNCTEGWLAKTQLLIEAWSDTPEERMKLRQALRAIVIANLPVFEEQGMTQVELKISDGEDLTSFNAPVYRAEATFSCLAPAIVGVSYGDVVIGEVDVTAIVKVKEFSYG